MPQGQQSPTNGGRTGKERRNRSHTRSDLIINLVITKVILILRQYKQNTMLSLTECSSIKEKKLEWLKLIINGGTMIMEKVLPVQSFEFIDFLYL